MWSRTSPVELHEQLRLHGRSSLDGVEAVVMERNGSMSVVASGTALEPGLFGDVLGSERLFPAGGPG